MTATAGITTNEGRGRELTIAAIRRLIATRQDNELHTVRVAGDRYRVMAVTDPDGTLRIVGLPTDDVDETLSNMLAWFALLTVFGVLVAAPTGTWLVRRQLRPLHAVAETAREVTTHDPSTAAPASAPGWPTT